MAVHVLRDVACCHLFLGDYARFFFAFVLTIFNFPVSIAGITVLRVTGFLVAVLRVFCTFEMVFVLAVLARGLAMILRTAVAAALRGVDLAVARLTALVTC